MSCMSLHTGTSPAKLKPCLGCFGFTLRFLMIKLEMLKKKKKKKQVDETAACVEGNK